jgi:beta-ribofuranosylaminobenzene 5'-phosphate synthase
MSGASGLKRRGGAHGAGMSSFGPTAYAIGEDADDLKKTAEDFLGVRGQVFITKSRNTGARIEKF